MSYFFCTPKSKSRFSAMTASLLQRWNQARTSDYFSYILKSQNWSLIRIPVHSEQLMPGPCVQRIHIAEDPLKYNGHGVVLKVLGKDLGELGSNLHSAMEAP